MLEKVYKYLMHHHLGLIGIAAMILIVYVQTVIFGLQLRSFQEVEALKYFYQALLKPVVTFNTVGDENKEAPEKFADNEQIKKGLDFEAYGAEGFWVKWKKEKEQWLAMGWKLNRRHYEDRYRYFLYLEVKADKKDRIAIGLEDNERRYVPIVIKLTNQVTRIVIPLASLDEYLKDIEDPDNPERTKTISVDTFNWSWVERVRISPLWEDQADNTIFFEKMMLLIAR